MVGYNLAVQLQKAEQADAYEQVLQVIKKNDELSRGVVADYQNKLASQNEAYVKLQRKLKNAKISTGDCSLNADGVRLWNDSLAGQEGSTSAMSKNSTGTSSSSETSSTITFDELMYNKLKNDEICNGLRNQINSIRAWDKEVWNDKDTRRN